MPNYILAPQYKANASLGRRTPRLRRGTESNEHMFSGPGPPWTTDRGGSVLIRRSNPAPRVVKLPPLLDHFSPPTSGGKIVVDSTSLTVDDLSTCGNEPKAQSGSRPRPRMEMCSPANAAAIIVEGGESPITKPIVMAPKPAALPIRVRLSWIRTLGATGPWSPRLDLSSGEPPGVASGRVKLLARLETF